MQRRFSVTCRTYLAVVSLALYVVTKLSMSLIAGGVVLQSLLGWNMWVSIVSLVCVTGAYVVSGGMSAVICTLRRTGKPRVAPACTPWRYFPITSG